MSYILERPEYAVRVDGGFVDRRQWLIRGVVEYRPFTAARSRADLEAEARFELMLAITRESQSARASGALAVYVSVDGDDEIAGFFRMLDRSAGRI